MTGQVLDAKAVTDDAAAAGSGVAHAGTLLAFVDAAVTCDDEVLARARADVLAKLGPEELVDAAAVVGNFERMVRIADSTGIPLDAPLTALTEDIRAELGIDRFGSAVNTPGMGTLGRTAGRLLRPVLLRALRLTGSLRGRP
jgi:hypothetical protein